MKRFSTLVNRTNKVNELKAADKQQYQQEEVKSIRIHILGPRRCGKTSFLYKTYFKYNVNQPDTHFDVIPTPTHNVEVIPYQSHQFELWDFAEISSCLNYLNEQTRVIIYMIDSTAYEKETVASKSKENMIWLLETYQKILKKVIIITVATKQDTQPTMDIQDIGNSWVNDKTLMNLLQGHDWRIFSCNNLTGEGLDSIFDYITLKLNQARTSHQSLNRPVSLLSPTPSVNQQIDIITPWDQLPNPHHFSDQEFYTWFYQGKAFLFFDYICLIRIIYLSMAQHQPMQPLFEQLEYILSLMPEIDTFKSIPYSETQTLFWIQMVSFALLKSPLLEGENNDFESFLIQSQLDEDCWKTYYTHKLFNSDKATKEFMPPDKKSLPNAFRSSSLNLKGSQLNINYQVL